MINFNPDKKDDWYKEEEKKKQPERREEMEKNPAKKDTGREGKDL